jgi:hypothetical protein
MNSGRLYLITIYDKYELNEDLMDFCTWILIIIADYNLDEEWVLVHACQYHIK